MRPIVVGRKYWLTTKHGVKVIVIAKQADESSGSSMGFVRVEIESNGMEIHVKRANLHNVKFIAASWREKIRYIGLAAIGFMIILAALGIWKHFSK